MNESPHKHKLQLAIWVLLFGCLVNAFAAALVKFASSRGLSPPMLVFGRYFVALFFVIPWIAYSEKSFSFTTKVKTKRPWMHVIRSIATTISIILYYTSLHHLSLSDATLLYLTVPLFMPFVAYFWGKEKIYPPLWWGIALGFVGVSLVIKPGHELFQWASLAALVSGIFATFGQYAIRLLSFTEPNKRINFYFFAIAAASAALLSLLHPMQNWMHLTRWDLLVFLGLGVLGAIYVPCLTTALKYAPAPLISSFLYTTVLFALILDAVIWKQIPSVLSIVGFSLVILGVLLKIYLHKHKPTV